jgi:hypothetical protein
MDSQNNAAATSVQSVVLRPEWAKMKEQGWKFTYDHKTRFLGAEHPNGGKFSIACFERHVGDRETLAHQIGATIATVLND